MSSNTLPFTAPASLVSYDEILPRLEAARKARDRMRIHMSAPRREAWELTSYHLAWFVAMPLETLEIWCPCGEEGRRWSIILHRLSLALTDFPWVIRHYVQAPRIFGRPSHSSNLQCLVRDGNRCVLTGAAGPDACQIIPVARNKDEDSNNAMDILDLLYMDFVAADVDSDDYVPLSRRGAEKAWNWICLSTHVHCLWSRCYFGFKWLDKTPKNDSRVTATLQFRWLPRAKRDPSSLASLELVEQALEDANGFNNELYNPPGFPPLSITNLSTNLPIQSGHTIAIDMPADEIDHFEEAIRLQWMLVQMGALSGAAANEHSMCGYDSLIQAFPKLPDGTPGILSDDLGHDIRVRDEELACESVRQTDAAYTTLPVREDSPDSFSSFSSVYSVFPRQGPYL